MKLDLNNNSHTVGSASYGHNTWRLRSSSVPKPTGFQDPYRNRYKAPPLPTAVESSIQPGAGIRQHIELGNTIVYPDLSVEKVERAIEFIMDSPGYTSTGSPGYTSTGPYGSTLDMRSDVERATRTIKSRRSGRSHAQELLGDLMSNNDLPIPGSEYELPEALSHFDIEHMVADEPAYAVALMEFMDENIVTAKSMTRFNDRFELKNLNAVFN